MRMDKFYDTLRNKYKQELQTEVQNSDWDKFNKFRNSKNRKKRIMPIVLLAASVMLLLFSIIFNYSSIENRSIVETQLNHTSETKDKNISHNSAVLTDGQNNKIETLENLSSDIIRGTKEKTATSIDLYSSPKKKVLGGSKKINNLNNSNIAQSNNYILKKGERNSFAEILSKTDYDQVAQLESPSIAEHLAYIEPITNNSDNLSVSTSNLKQTHVVPLLQEYNITPSSLKKSFGVSIHLLKGQDLLRSEKFIEDNSRMIGFGLVLHPKGVVRYRADFQLISHYYLSNSMGPQYGIALLENPTEEVVFARASVEAKKLQFSLGFDASIWKKGNVEIYTGASYGLQKTVKKELEYDFEGMEDDSVEDDIKIVLSNQDKKIRLGALTIRSGINYAIGPGSVFAELTYNNLKESPDNPLPNMLSISGGVTFRF